MALKDLFAFRDFPGGYESAPPYTARITPKTPVFRTPPGFYGLFVSRAVGMSSAQYRSEPRAETIVPVKSGSSAASVHGKAAIIAKPERGLK